MPFLNDISVNRGSSIWVDTWPILMKRNGSGATLTRCSHPCWRPSGHPEQKPGTELEIVGLQSVAEDLPDLPLTRRPLLRPDAEADRDVIRMDDALVPGRGITREEHDRSVGRAADDKNLADGLAVELQGADGRAVRNPDDRHARPNEAPDQVAEGLAGRDTLDGQPRHSGEPVSRDHLAVRHAAARAANRERRRVIVTLQLIADVGLDATTRTHVHGSPRREADRTGTAAHGEPGNGGTHRDLAGAGPDRLPGVVVEVAAGLLAVQRHAGDELIAVQALELVRTAEACAGAVRGLQDGNVSASSATAPSTRRRRTATAPSPAAAVDGRAEDEAGSRGGKKPQRCPPIDLQGTPPKRQIPPGRTGFLS